MAQVITDVAAFDAQVADFKAEYEKFQRGNKSAGTRARKALMEIKKLAGEIRMAISAQKAVAK